MTDYEVQNTPHNFYLANMASRTGIVKSTLPALSGSSDALADVVNRHVILQTVPAARARRTFLSIFDSISRTEAIDNTDNLYLWSLKNEWRQDSELPAKIEELLAYADSTQAANASVGESRVALELIDNLKKALLLQMVRPSKEDMPKIAGFMSFEGFGVIANEVESYLGRMGSDRPRINEFLSQFMQQITDTDTLKNSDWFQQNRQRFMMSIRDQIAVKGTKSIWYEHAKDLFSLDGVRQQRLYGLGSEEVTTLNATLEKLATPRAKAPNTYSVMNSVSSCLRMMADTVDAAEDMNLPNARLITPIVRGKYKVDGKDMPRAGQFVTYIQLANGLLNPINERRALQKEERFVSLSQELKSLPEAFRRIMYVIFDGDEEHEGFFELDMGTRFEILEKLNDALELNHSSTAKSSKTGSIAVRGARGAIPSSPAHAQWNKWVRGYGVIS